ncbi:hypothetical protein CYMTET_30068 [Cymbomonas tetramitiformis]|uniref:EF-hand domain-containing protein n=1 Tax=Cymbomonas tetramitiformis TaxID=36881 RepID=A0AAE0FJJ3_9CHLO|nr:hypothetical protein CYMTET_30068 [Cymbomonas tetramitiformis]
MMEKALKDNNTAIEISFTDFLKLIYPRAAKEAITLMYDLVVDKASVSEILKQRKRRENAITWVEERWLVWDADLSGQISEDEFDEVLDDMGLGHLDQKALRALFNEIDLDGNGTLSKEEVLDWWVNKQNFLRPDQVKVQDSETPRAVLDSPFGR